MILFNTTFSRFSKEKNDLLICSLFLMCRHLVIFETLIIFENVTLGIFGLV